MLNPAHHLNASRLDLVVPFLNYHLSTPWWIPVAVGLGGAVLAVVQPALDNRRRMNSKAVEVREPAFGWAPEANWVLLGAALLLLQYRAVGGLVGKLGGSPLWGLPKLEATLAIGAASTWAVLDGTRQGLLVGLLTVAVAAGVEVYLTGHLGLYKYAGPVLFGALPTWLPFMQFAAAPVAANFGRWLRRRL